MPAEDLAPCGFGAFGTCCCTCRYHARTLARARPRKQKKRKQKIRVLGYACTLFRELAGGFVQTEWNKHGACEGYLEAEKQCAPSL